jgi:CHAT domain
MSMLAQGHRQRRREAALTAVSTASSLNKPGRSCCCCLYGTGAMKRLTAAKMMGCAEAMRQAMVELMDRGEPNEAHPAYWAPFIVVGKGGTRN